MKITDSLIDFFDRLIDLIPDGNKRKEFELEFARIMAGLKQPIVLSILTILFYLVFQTKTIIVDSYLLSTMFYIDLTFAVIAISFQFGVAYKDIIKLIKHFSKKKKEK